MLAAVIAGGWGATKALAEPVTTAANLIENVNPAFAVYSEGYKAQTFTAQHSGLLVGVDLQLGRSPELGGSISVGVMDAGSDGRPAPGLVGGISPASRSVAVSTIPTNTTLGANWATTPVDFTPNMVELQAGRQYAIAVRATGAGEPPWLLWGATSDVYAGGMMFNDDRDSSNESYREIENGAYDAGFAVRVDPMLRVSEGTVTLTPTYDVRATPDGNGGYTLLDGEIAINTQQYAPASVDRRALLGFDLSGIPEGADITAAALALDVQAYTTGTADDLTVMRVYGHSDNGVADAADATGTGDTFAITRWRDVPPDPLRIGGGVAGIGLLEDVLSGSGFLGLTITGPEDGTQLGFWTTEAAAFGTPPTLTVSYRYIEAVPEPATASLLVLGGVLLTRRRGA